MEPELNPQRHVVLLTAGRRYGNLVLAEFARRGIVLPTLVVYTRPAIHWWTMGRLRHLATIPIAPFYFLRAAWRRARIRRSPRFAPRATRVVVTGAINSPMMLRDLSRLAPDVLVLADCGLLQPHIVNLAREGVLNVHQGLLPWMRGNGAVGHSVLRGTAVGCTAYWVDAGTDTGRMITRRLLRVTGAEQSLQALEAANDDLAAEMTADLVTSAMAGEALPAGIAQNERFPVCRWLPPEEQLRVDELVAGGAALALFETWRVRSVDDGLELPADMVAPAEGGNQ